jgi:hypothetical protein
MQQVAIRTLWTAHTVKATQNIKCWRPRTYCLRHHAEVLLLLLLPLLLSQSSDRASSFIVGIPRIAITCRCCRHTTLVSMHPSTTRSFGRILRCRDPLKMQAEFGGDQPLFMHFPPE